MDDSSSPPLPIAGPPPAALSRCVVLVGLMGAGKSSVGRRLAKLLHAGFTDADDEIVTAASMSITDIFATYGERAFRDLERRVVIRLLDQPPHVLALGGGAFIDAAIRAKVQLQARTIWLRADLDTLLARTARRRTRPLLNDGDPSAILGKLMQERYPVYAQADHVIDTASEPADTIASRIAALVRQAEAQRHDAA